MDQDTKMFGLHEIPVTYILEHINQDITRKDMTLNAISMNSALADKEFVLSLHRKLHGLK